MANWDEASPGDSDIISQFPANERAARGVVKTVFGIDHHEEDDANQGFHDFVTLISQGASPVGAAGLVTMWMGDSKLRFRIGTGAVQDVAGAGTLSAPAGTRMVFHQTAAPTGWTKETSGSFNDRALIVTTGTVQTAGSWQITGLTHDHFHGLNITSGAASPGGTIQAGTGGSLATPDHTHFVSGVTGSPNVTAIVSDAVWRPNYTNVIIAAKD